MPENVEETVEDVSEESEISWQKRKLQRMHRNDLHEEDDVVKPLFPFLVNSFCFHGDFKCALRTQLIVNSDDSPLNKNSDQTVD